MPALSGTWEQLLKPEFSKPYYKNLFREVSKAYKETTVYPKADDIFRAFHLTPPEKIKIVILGQDPYHEPGEAHGLAFSVPKGTKIPPSLENIYKELNADLGIPIPKSGDLTKWAEEGVFLLNTVLTVKAHQAFSMKGIGWEEFTDAAIESLNQLEQPMVFILWGKAAGEKESRIKKENRLILKSAHPSPLSAYRGFFGSRVFSKANCFLSEHGVEPVDFSLCEEK